MSLPFIFALAMLCGIMLYFAKYNVGLCCYALFISTSILMPSSITLFSFSVTTLLSYILTLIAFYRLFFKYKVSMSSFNKDVFKILIIQIFAFFILMFLALDVDIYLQLQFHKNTLLFLQFPFFTSILIKDRSNLQYIWAIVWCISLIACLYGLYCYVTQTNVYITMIDMLYPDNDIAGFLRYMDEERGGLTGRVSSVSISPVYYAGALIILFFVSVQATFNSLKNKNKIYSIGWIIVLLLISVNLVLTGTRSGLIAFIIGVFYILYHNTSVKTKFKLIFVGGIILIFIFLSSAGNILGQYQEMVDSVFTNKSLSGSSTGLRVQQLEGTFHLVDGIKILFGKGHGWINYYIKENGPHPVLYGFESVLFSGIIQYGIIGFCFLYLYLFYLLYKLNRKYSKKSSSTFNKNINYHITNGFLISYLAYAFLTGAFYWIFFIGMYIFSVKSSFILSEKES